MHLVCLSTHLVTVPLENRPGALAKVTRQLASVGINLEGFCISGEGVRFILHGGHAVALDALEGAGFHPQAHEVAAVHIPNQRGELARLCEDLAGAQINIEQGFGLAMGGEGRVYIRLDDLRKASPILTARTDVLVVHSGLRRI